MDDWDKWYPRKGPFNWWPLIAWLVVCGLLMVIVG